MIDHCALAHRQCDATKRDWDGPLSPYCWRYQEHGRKAAEADADRLAGAVYLQRQGHLDHLAPINCVPGTCRTCDAMHAALAAHEALKTEEVT